VVNLPWFIKILNIQTYSNTEMRPRSATPPSGWSVIGLVAVTCTPHLFVEKQKTNFHLNNGSEESHSCESFKIPQ
jgi:hypothetical protein